MSKNNEITIDGKRYKLEEIEEPEVEPAEVDKSIPWRAEEDGEYLFLDRVGNIMPTTDTRHAFDDWGYLTGNYFQTEEAILAYKEYLEAKAVITKDAGGYEWALGGNNYYGYYDVDDKEVRLNDCLHTYTPDTIYFKDSDSIRESQDNHSKEWEIYTKYKLPKGE